MLHISPKTHPEAEHSRAGSASHGRMLLALMLQTPHLRIRLLALPCQSQQMLTPQQRRSLPSRADQRHQVLYRHACIAETEVPHATSVGGSLFSYMLCPKQAAVLASDVHKRS